MTQVINDRKQDKRIGDWIAEKVDVDYAPSSICFATEENGVLLAGAMLNEYNGVNVCIHQRCDTPRGMTRPLLQTVFSFIFNHLECKRATGVVRISQPATVRLNERMGFEVEGVLKNFLPGGDGYVNMVLWPENCRFL